MIWLLLPVFVVLWMLGGQINTAIRRYGLPVLSSIAAFIVKRKGRGRWIGFVILLYIPILCIGYGIDSKLGKWLGGREWLIRLLYSFVCCVPLVGILGFTGEWWKLIVIVPVVIGVFQIRAGSLGKIWDCDILVEDICRATILGSAIIWSLG